MRAGPQDFAAPTKSLLPSFPRPRQSQPSHPGSHCAIIPRNIPCSNPCLSSSIRPSTPAAKPPRRLDNGHPHRIRSQAVTRNGLGALVDLPAPAQRHGREGRAKDIHRRPRVPRYRCPGEYLHRRHVGPLAQERRLWPHRDCRRRLPADAPVGLHAHGVHHRGRGPVGRQVSPHYPRRHIPQLLHQRRLRVSGNRHEAVPGLFQAHRRAHPHQVHQPQGVLSRRNLRRSVPRRLPGHAQDRLRTTFPRSIPCSPASSLPLRIRRRHAGGMRRALRRGNRRHHQVSRPRNNRRGHRRARGRPLRSSRAWSQLLAHAA